MRRLAWTGKGRYSDNMLSERLWRAVKYEEKYLKAYTTVLGVKTGWKVTPVLQRTQAPSVRRRPQPRVETRSGLPDTIRGVPLGSRVP